MKTSQESVKEIVESIELAIEDSVMSILDLNKEANKEDVIKLASEDVKRSLMYNNANSVGIEIEHFMPLINKVVNKFMNTTEMTFKIKVIKITFNGEISFLAHTGYNDDYENQNPKTVKLIMAARNYALPQNENKLEKDLHCFYITGCGGAKSGIRADSIELVEYEGVMKEVFQKLVKGQ